MARELISTPTTSAELHDQKARLLNEAAIQEANIQAASNNIADESRKLSSNVLSYAAGSHPGIIIDKRDTCIIGLGDTILNPTCILTGTTARTQSAILNNRCRFSNIRFAGDVTFSDRGVTEDVTGIFVNCVFDGSIGVAANDNAHFIGCVFNSSTVCIINFGTSFVIGCSRPNGGVHQGAPTIIAETT